MLCHKILIGTKPAEKNLKIKKKRDIKERIYA